MAEDLLSVAEARARVRAAARELVHGGRQARRVGLQQAVGCCLAEAVVADRDAPAFDRAMVDGFALRAADVPTGTGPSNPARLRVIGLAAAGEIWPGQLDAGLAVAIMTGAAVPAGADTVVMVETTNRWTPSSGQTNYQPGPLDIHQTVRAGANIALQGCEARAGREILPPGSVITPASIGALAAVGLANPLVVPPPTVAILATGSELVAITQTPTGGAIRNSNSWSVAAFCAAMGCPATILPPVDDDRQRLKTALAQALETAEVVLVTGGVSMGDRDLVPPTLATLGVRLEAHRVAMRPGKPFLLGTRPTPVSDDPSRGVDRLVFGLPGNPVSAVVCCVLLVAPALEIISGRDRPSSPPPSGELAHDSSALPDDGRTALAVVQGLPLAANGPRQAYLPAQCRPATLSGPTPGLASVRRLDSAGSADVFALAGANALIIRPPNDGPRAAGEVVPILELPDGSGRLGGIPSTSR